MLTRKGRFEHTVPAKIEFGEGQELNVSVRKVSRSWGNIKQLMAVSRDVAQKARRADELKKGLDGLDAAAKAAAENEIADLEAESSQNVEVLIDWMAGIDDHPAAIADWDYYEDGDGSQRVAITRIRIEEFEPAEIAAIAAGILQSLSVPEANAEPLHGGLRSAEEAATPSQTGSSNSATSVL